MEIKKNNQKIEIDNWLLFLFVKNKKKGLKVGWTINKFIGNAVVRNKIKRWLRSCFYKKFPDNNNNNININVILKKKEKDFYKKMKYFYFEKSFIKGKKLILQSLNAKKTDL